MTSSYSAILGMSESEKVMSFFMLMAALLCILGGLYFVAIGLMGVL